MAGSKGSARTSPATYRPEWTPLLALAGLAALAGACFEPAYPTGIPCSGAQTCPPGQICDPSDRVCRVAPRPDASPGAMPDAGADAGPGDTPDARIDACASAPCGPGVCESAPDGYTCTCDSGYEFDGTTCADIDECAAATDPCGPGTCANADGGYTCACEPGYEFDGTTCADIDECAVTPDPCAPNGACVNGDNEYTCACDDGYAFDGTTCVLVTFGITGAGTAEEPRRFEDGTAAESCQAYRFPALPYVYEGDTGDGIYLIQPAGRDTPVAVLCDMTTDGGGWTGIDPAAAAAFGGVATAVYTEGADVATVVCRVQDGLFEAFYRGTATKAVVCQYDIDLGFFVDTLRLVETPEDQMVFTSVTSGNDTTDVSDDLAFPWGEPLVESRGDALIGTSAHPGPVLGLANAGGAGNYPNGALMRWPGTHRASTNVGTVLRIQVSERGTQDEGYRWTGGRVYVRDDGALGPLRDSGPE